MPVTPTPGKQNQEHQEFKETVSLLLVWDTLVSVVSKVKTRVTDARAGWRCFPASLSTWVLSPYAYDRNRGSSYNTCPLTSKCMLWLTNTQNKFKKCNFFKNLYNKTKQNKKFQHILLHKIVIYELDLETLGFVYLVSYHSQTLCNMAKLRWKWPLANDLFLQRISSWFTIGKSS